MKCDITNNANGYVVDGNDFEDESECLAIKEFTD